MARILVTGITGQDGSYLTESHLASGDEVHGLVRQSSLMQRTRLDALPALIAAREEGRLRLHYADLSDTSSLVSVLRSVKPDVDLPPRRAEPRQDLVRPAGVYGRLDGPRDAAPARGPAERRARRAVLPRGDERDLRRGGGVAADRDDPDEPDQPVRGREGVRAEPRADLPEGVRPLRVRGYPLQPREPAPAARTTSRARSRARQRGSRGERRRSCTSARSRRSATGATRPTSWTASAASSAAPKPDDFVLASGVTHSVGDFCEAAFAVAGLDHVKHVVLDPEYVRPIDISETRGDASKARRELGWAPKTGFDALVQHHGGRRARGARRPRGKPPEASGRPRPRLPARGRLAPGDPLASRGRRAAHPLRRRHRRGRRGGDRARVSLRGRRPDHDARLVDGRDQPRDRGRARRQ